MDKQYSRYVAFRQDGSEVKPGEMLDEHTQFICATAVTIPGKSGKVFTTDLTNPRKQWKRELYAHIFDLKVRLVFTVDDYTYSAHFGEGC